MGKRELVVSRTLENGEIYNGMVQLISGEIAEDLVHYLRTSEQIPSAMLLGVLVEKDQILRQDPDPDTKVKVGKIVSVVLSKGKEVLEFPDVKNISKENALYKIQSAGFKGGKDTYDTVHSSTIPAGLVVDQDPAPQASWFKNKDFKLTISDGPEVITISMPNVLGKTSADAKSLLEQNKLKVILDSQESNVYPKDVVISSKPEPDASVQQWTEVTLVVSGGPGPTPKQLSQNDILVSLLQLVPNDGKSHDVTIKVNDYRGWAEVWHKPYRVGETSDLPQDIRYYPPATMQITVDGTIQFENKLT